jgi:hypothetical protein
MSAEAQPGAPGADTPATNHDARLMRRLMGVSLGFILGPAYVLTLVLLLRESRPTALGTYSFLIGGPLVFTLLTTLVTKRTFVQTFVVTMAGHMIVGATLHAAEIETGLCLIILLAPWIVGSSLFSFVAFALKLRRLHGKIPFGSFVRSVLLALPLWGAIVEDRYLASQSSKRVEASIVVAAHPDTIWAGIVEVAPFTDRELPATWLQQLGVPRPVHATIRNTDAGLVRFGHFEDGSRFHETVTTYAPARELGLAVTSVELPADALALTHAFSDGYVRIDDVRYQLHDRNGAVALTLSCEYTVRTTVRQYAQFAGDLVIESFQHELLRALASRFEHRVRAGGTTLVAGRSERNAQRVSREP